MKSFLSISAIVVILAFGAVLITYAGPCGAPGACNAPAPLNVSDSQQTKLGALFLNSSTSPMAVGLKVISGTSIFGGKVQIMDGTEGEGKILMSNASGTASWVPVSAVQNSDAPAASEGYYFGGMFGNGATGYTNPLAGNTKSCPTGYSSYRVLGSADTYHNIINDQAVTLCIGDPISTDPVGSFGGMYGNGSTLYSNPFANNTMACPTGFSAQGVSGKAAYGTAGQSGSFNGDKYMWYCYSTDSSADDQFGVFGGIWGSYASYDASGNWLGAGYYENGVSGGHSCQPGYGTRRVIGTNSVDWSMFICYPSSVLPPISTAGMTCTASKNPGVVSGNYQYLTYTINGTPTGGDSTSPYKYEFADSEASGGTHPVAPVTVLPAIITTKSLKINYPKQSPLTTATNGVYVHDTLVYVLSAGKSSAPITCTQPTNTSGNASPVAI